MLRPKASNGKVTSGFLSTLLETAAVAMLFAAWSVSQSVLLSLEVTEMSTDKAVFCRLDRALPKRNGTSRSIWKNTTVDTSTKAVYKLQGLMIVFSPRVNYT
jgi:hypothetical protein